MLFYQIVTLHAFVLGVMLPLVFGLLPNKDGNTYIRFLSLVKEKSESIGFTISPQRTVYHAGFRERSDQCLPTRVPRVIVKGCYFHYAQCLWWRIQGIGLPVSYRENADHRNWFRTLLAMPFVPVPHVKDAFQFVKNTAPDVPRVREFNDYFDRTWMNVQYPIEMWNFFKYDSLRTNNHVEGYHTRLMRKAGKIHPNIFEVVELFSQEEAASLVSIL